MNVVSRGVWSGVLATSVMTVAFFEFWRRLPSAKREALPPAQLTESLSESIGEVPEQSETRSNDTMLAHFAFGISTAIVYAAATQILKVPRGRNWAITKGLTYGSLVWTGSYLGWIPALSQRPSAVELKPGQNVMMIVSHWVWGACLGIAEEELAIHGQKMLDGARA